MASQHGERRLTTILAADVVGYSRLMSADEAGTLEHLKALRKELVEPRTAEHRGRVVKLMGDGTLMEFASVVDAVRFAVEIQRAMAERNAQVPEARRITFRIGINIGDVIVEGDDLYGDGVNIAARLEGLAEPGGICVSDMVRQGVEGKLDLSFQDLGERPVKNIDKLVHVHRVLSASRDGRQPAAPPGKRYPGWLQLLAAIAALILLAGTAIIVWLEPWAPPMEPASVEHMAFPLPDKPSIAVLPFDNLSDDPDQEYFADGMTDDLITDLSQLSELFVIARNSVFAYKGRPTKIAQVAEDLGVRYVLEGSVRRAGDQVRINAQLIDATTGGPLWAERYDGNLSDVFALQDAVTGRVVEALQLHLTEQDRDRRTQAPGTSSPEAYDLVLQARKLMTRFDRPAAAEARTLLEKAIELDPGYGEAHTLLGLHHFDLWRLWGENRNANLSRALEFATSAAELDPLDPAPHVLSAQIHQFRREFDAANAEADAALDLGLSDAIMLANLGSMLRYAHRAEEAAMVVERAIRLDPFHPPNYLEWLGDAYLLLGRYDDCIEVVERGIALDPDFVALHVVAAECHAALGNEEKARQAGADILRVNPRFTLKAFASYVPFTEASDLQLKVSLLREAGLPE
jgi:adenylate cyclase